MATTLMGNVFLPGRHRCDTHSSLPFISRVNIVTLLGRVAFLEASSWGRWGCVGNVVALQAAGHGNVVRVLVSMLVATTCWVLLQYYILSNRPCRSIGRLFIASSLGERGVMFTIPILAKACCPKLLHPYMVLLSQF